MAKFIDDELSDLPVTKPTTTTAAAATATATEEASEEDIPVKATPSKTSAVTTDDDENLDVSFGDQKLMAKGDGLNRIRADKNRNVRFALLPFINPKMAKSHFVEVKDKKGTYRCAPVKSEDEIPYCCQKLEEDGMQHVVALALLYTNADPKTGVYEKGTPIDWEIGFVDLSRSNYRAVSNLAPEDSDVFSIDIVMSKKDSGIGYEFVLRSAKAKWKQNPELAAEVEAAAQKFIKDGGKKLIGKLGRKLSVAEWKILLSGQQAASGKEASLEDLEGME